MKIVNKVLVIFILINTLSFSQRIKDIAYLNGSNTIQIIGYALVVGLDGSGDSHRTSFTIQSISSMLKRFGITIQQDDIRTRNVAAVMVTASINNFLKPGSKFDVNVSSLGDARSLQGGTLLMTPLSSVDGTVYGMAQGPISVGGFDINTQSGGRISKNHVLAGRVPSGGILEHELASAGYDSAKVKIYLRQPDITTANNVATSINSSFGGTISRAADPSEIIVEIPSNKRNNLLSFFAEIEAIQVETDYIAKVVLNERTGTVVAGHNVKIQPVTISHGGLNINVESYPVVSQPGAFSKGRSIFFNNLVPNASEDSTRVVALEAASNVQEVAAALNSLKVSPKDVIAIFQALKESGALTAELVII